MKYINNMHSSIKYSPNLSKDIDNNSGIVFWFQSLRLNSLQVIFLLVTQMKTIYFKYLVLYIVNFRRHTHWNIYDITQHLAMTPFMAQEYYENIV